MRLSMDYFLDGNIGSIKQEINRFGRGGGKVLIISIARIFIIINCTSLHRFICEKILIEKFLSFHPIQIQQNVI